MFLGSNDAATQQNNLPDWLKTKISELEIAPSVPAHASQAGYHASVRNGPQLTGHRAPADASLSTLDHESQRFAFWSHEVAWQKKLGATVTIIC